MSRRLLIALAAVALIVAIGALSRRAPGWGSGADEPRVLLVYGTADAGIMRPILGAYRALHPGLRIGYVEMDGATLYHRVLADLAAHRPGADLVLSTAMDLQVKLVNDGYALTHRSSDAAALPPWARWRDQAFGVTFEPAVMVFNRTLMGKRPIPRSRAELLAAIAADPGFWRGRIGTYDIRSSATGYLLASQESRQSTDFGALTRAFGTAHVRLSDQSDDLLRRLEDGGLAVGYNVLSSYTRRRLADGAPLAIVFPRDFTLAVLRTAILPRNAAHPQAAHAFLDFLLSVPGQRIVASRAGLNAIREDIGNDRHDVAQAGILRPIPLGPGLLVYLDAHKRRRLLAGWSDLVKSTGP